jgi:tetratricopeptide (TPR) repeat protein
MRRNVWIWLWLGTTLACSRPTPAPASGSARAESAKPGGLARCELAQSAPDDRDPERYVRAGSDYVRKARAQSEPVYYEHARVCVQGALNRQPGHRGARRLAGLISLNEHAFAAARDGALALISEDADDAMSWGTLSDARLELGDVPGAIEAAQRMLDLKPNLPAYGRAAHLRWLQGDIAGAKRLYELAIASGAGARDHEPRAWMITEAARVFWHEGDYRGADAGFELALREVAGYAPALEGKGRVALALGDYAAAVRWLEQALAARPLAETAWLLGDAHRLAGDERAAAAAYERVVNEHHDPRTLALFYATHAREPARALKLARAEHELRQDPYSQDALAFALYRSGDYAEAKRRITEARAHGTPDARLLYHAGLIERAVGADAAGRALLAAALQMNPRFDPILTGGTDGNALARTR